MAIIHSKNTPKPEAQAEQSVKPPLPLILPATPAENKRRGIGTGYIKQIHDAEEAGKITTGWIRNVYPTRTVAEAALQRGDLFVMEDNDQVVGAALINQIQVDVYDGAPWEHDGEVCVLHTLVISPRIHGKGAGRKFVEFYENYAFNHGWHELRIDTNARNERARKMYAGMGYKEIAIVPTVFNGIPDVNLVLLEKKLL